MDNKYNTSLNIIRDEQKSMEDYIPTTNSYRIVKQINDDFARGLHSFTIIGSYGTGKSSFLNAFDLSLKGSKKFKVDLGLSNRKIRSVRLVGGYYSLLDNFRNAFNVSNDFEGNQQLFDSIYQELEKNDLLVLYIDEFGKHLEYAAKNNPESELYFIQQLSEFANDKDRNVLLITTLHQNFDGYGLGLSNEVLKNEWKKVRGRFKELPFNEPVEQLLVIASDFLKNQINKVDSKFELARNHSIIAKESTVLEKLGDSLSPFDIISASIYTQALKTCGQNERSLFSLLTELKPDSEWLSLDKVYDYLEFTFYSFIHSTSNPQRRQWQSVQNSIERAHSVVNENKEIALSIIKTVGLIGLYSRKGAQVNKAFLIKYFETKPKNIESVIDKLESLKIIRFADYLDSYIILDGTNVDFTEELQKAEGEINPAVDLVPLLKEHFDFPIVQAKTISYNLGTPRLFKFEISHSPISTAPEGAIDGFVNLLFNEEANLESILSFSSEQPEAIVYALFENTADIRDQIFEIQKTIKARDENIEDSVAKEEFENILSAREHLLTHTVLGSLYSEKTQWVFDGESRRINNKRELNGLLSAVCSSCYPNTPIFKNELLNKHKISTSIHTARKAFLNQLDNFHLESNLGFSEERFPPEKSIYLSLLESNGMHQNGVLSSPNNQNGFDTIWNTCQEFLENTRQEPVRIDKLINILESRPFKLKRGLIDFWLPTFMFIQRHHFALYEFDRGEKKFVPELNHSVLYNITRYPEKFEIKAFQITDLRLDLFNRYREIAKQPELNNLSNEAFIESVRPFLLFYKQLNEYSQKTKRLSKESIRFRDAIVNAKDPEETFFEIIPDALGMSLKELSTSDTAVAEFALNLNNSIEELKFSYSALLDRFESFVQNELIGKKVAFSTYKKQLQKRFSGIKEHQLLQHQMVLVKRMQSSINDRDSWLASIAQAILGKHLNRIDDKDELVLYEKLARLIKELDNLATIHFLQEKTDDEVIRLELTTNEGLKDSNVLIPKSKMKDLNSLIENLEKNLGSDPKLKLAALAKLLCKELKND